jgi:hypothetical protein
MPNIDKLRSELVTEYYDNSVMLNVSMNIEQFLSDEVLLYPYKNWHKGEIIAGPYIKRYNVSIILRYDYKDMPDPEGALVLKKFGATVTYHKINETVEDKDVSKKQNKKVTKKEPAWFIQLIIPRDLVTDEKQRQQLDLVDELIDLEALEASADENEDEFSGDFGGDDFGGDDFGGDDNVEFDTPEEPVEDEE